METDDLVERIRALPKQEVLSAAQQAVEERECKTLKEEIETQPAPKGIAQQRGLDVFAPKKGLDTAVPVPAPNEEGPTPQQTAAINALREQIPLVKEETARILGKRPSEMYVKSPPRSGQPTPGEANTSPFFKTVQDVEKWIKDTWNNASKSERAALGSERDAAMDTLQRAMTRSQRKRAREKLAEKRAKKIGGADEALTEEQKLAEELYIKLLNEEPTGGSRKRTLKNRRGGKQTQNGRGTRRGKNRTDRSHPNSRRRT